jgi:mRNA interferase MazF
VQRGEVWQVDLPITPGHAQVGERPALIVQADPFIATLPTVSIVPFTGTRSAARFPATVLVQPAGQNGLTVPSIALVFQMRALDKRYFRHRLGILDAATLDRIFAELDKLTGR